MATRNNSQLTVVAKCDNKGLCFIALGVYLTTVSLYKNLPITTATAIFNFCHLLNTQESLSTFSYPGKDACLQYFIKAIQTLSVGLPCAMAHTQKNTALEIHLMWLNNQYWGVRYQVLLAWDRKEQGLLNAFIHVAVFAIFPTLFSNKSSLSQSTSYTG